MNNYFLKELYINKVEDHINGLLVISSLNDKVTFINIKQVFNDSSDFTSYFRGNLIDHNHEDQNWYWTKTLLNYMDTMLTKTAEVHQITSLEDIKWNDNISLYTINKINIDEIKILGRCEVISDDLLEITDKILKLDIDNSFLTKDLRKDLIDTHAWLLDSIFDNG